MPAGESTISRRDFLKIGFAGLVNLWAAPARGCLDLEGYVYGRVTANDVNVHQRPSLHTDIIRTLKKDTVISITSATVGEAEPIHNRIWYGLQDGGFVHSSVVQPVRNDINPVPASLDMTPELVEVSVPYTDARQGPGESYRVVYRCYFESVYWISGVESDHLGTAWFRIFDDKWLKYYYARAEHFHLLTPEDLNPVHTDIPPEAKRLEVHLRQQTVIAYEWDRPVFMTRVATGMKLRSGKYATPPGRFNINYKRPCRHMMAGDLASNGYDLPGVPWVSYFTKSGIAFHGTYWHNNFGYPQSHGCINLTPNDARRIYLWSLPSVLPGQEMVYGVAGTSVEVLP